MLEYFSSAHKKCLVVYLRIVYIRYLPFWFSFERCPKRSVNLLFYGLWGLSKVIMKSRHTLSKPIIKLMKNATLSNNQAFANVPNVNMQLSICASKRSKECFLPLGIFHAYEANERCLSHSIIIISYSFDDQAKKLCLIKIM